MPTGAAIPEGELAEQMRLLLPLEAELDAALAPALLRQVEAGAQALEDYPQDDAHMRAAVVLNRLGSGWIARHLERVALAFGARALRALGAGEAKAQGDEQDLIFQAAPGFRDLMRHWAQEQAAALVVNIDLATVDKLRAAVDAGLAEAEGQRPIARRIVEHVSGIGGLTARARSQVIARTETHGAATYGADEAAKASGLAYSRVWVSAGDARTRADHAAAHGQERGPEENFLVGGASMPRPGVGPAAQTVNCLLPGAEVFALGLRGASRRTYQGEAITFQTKSGAQLSCTINHPVLTACGWIAAQFIQEGDRVVGAPRREWLSAVAQDNQNGPPRIEDVERALQAIGVVRRQVIGVMDFHGEGGSGEVHIVSADGVLLGGSNPALAKQIAEAGFLGRSDVAQLLARSSHGGMPSITSRPMSRAVNAGQPEFARLIRHVSPFEPLSLTVCPRSAAVFLEGAKDHPPTNAVAAAHLADAFSAVVGGEKLRNVGRSPPVLMLRRPARQGGTSFAQNAHHRFDAPPGTLGDLALRQAGFVELDDVVSVSRKPWSGPVYNIETSSGLYLANGIVTHNCRCVLRYKPQDFRRWSD